MGAAPWVTSSRPSTHRCPGREQGSRFGTGWLQGFAGAAGGFALRWWFRLGIEGASNVPGSGPAVIAMNHESALDVP